MLLCKWCAVCSNNKNQLLRVPVWCQCNFHAATRCVCLVQWYQWKGDLVQLIALAGCATYVYDTAIAASDAETLGGFLVAYIVCLKLLCFDTVRLFLNGGLTQDVCMIQDVLDDLNCHACFQVTAVPWHMRHAYVCACRCDGPLQMLSSVESARNVILLRLNI